jgi:rod shape-determining protein MreC
MFFGLMTLWMSYALPLTIRFAADKVGVMLSYPETPVQEIRALVQTAGNWMMERKGLQDRNRELEIENLALRAALHDAALPPPVSTSEMIGARVTLRYPDAWWKEVRINMGSSQGVKIGAPVLSEGYMIGKIIMAGENYSWVELITSASFLLAAVVNETWDLGVINGDDRGNIWLLYMPPEREFKRGMMVSTAMVGDYLPPGIPIGKIWGDGDTRDGFTPRSVVSGAHLTQLYNLQVLLIGDVSGVRN